MGLAFPTEHTRLVKVVRDTELSSHSNNAIAELLHKETQAPAQSVHCTDRATSAVHWFSNRVSGFTGYVISALSVNWSLIAGIAGGEIIGVVS